MLSISSSNSNVSPWHQHLGHSSMKVVESLLSNCKVQVQGNKDQSFFCLHANLKRHTSFLLITSMTTEPLIYSNI